MLRRVSPAIRREPCHPPPAFTLVELLVVIAILTILLGILLPALGKARIVSRAAACLSNQRQIALALTMYCAEYREWVPREGTYGSNPDHARDRLPWPVALRPYLDERAGPNVDLNDAFEVAPYYSDPARPPDNHRIHYVNNGARFVAPGVMDTRGNVDTRHRRGPAPLSRHDRPAETLYITCFTDDPQGIIYSIFANTDHSDMAFAQMYDLWHPDHVILGPPDSVLLFDRIAPNRHENGANAVFIDGHARPALYAELTNPRSWDDGIYR